MGATKKKPRPKRAAARQGELPLNTQPTLKEIVGWYLDGERSRLRPHTWRARRQVLGRAVADLPTRPVAGDVRAWLAKQVEARKLSGLSANQYLKRLGRAYRFVRDDKYPGLLNIIANVPRFPVVSQRPKALPDAARDWSRCLGACEDDRERAFLSVMRRSGLRPGEALALEPRHVDLAKGTLQIEQARRVTEATAGALKTDTSAATVKLHPETAALLRPLLVEHRARAKGWDVGAAPKRGKAARAFLFPYFPATLEPLLTRLRQAVPEAFTRREQGARGGAAFHVFRHTFATALANQGLKDRDLMLLLRHKSLASTQEYIGSIRGREQPVEVLAAAWEAEAREEAAAAAESQVELPDARRGNSTGSASGSNVTRKGSKR